LNLIAESTKRLDHTILEILNYSRNARMDISLQPFNLKESIRDILIDLSSLRLGVETSFEWEGSDVVKQDEVRVGVLLKNILANAIKYSKGEAGEAFVKVNVYVNDEGFKIVISDNGEGIEEVHLEKVFDMFYRATNSSPGTGLGLYISKEITDKLGGTISIASSRGVGTEVTITLPQQAHEQIPTH
jgi:signal transduction histidine kinase